MTNRVTYFDKEFGVTRVDLLEAIASNKEALHQAMTMNRQLLQESNEKLLSKMDAEVGALEAKIDKLDTKIDSLYRWILAGIAMPILIQFISHIIK